MVADKAFVVASALRSSVRTVAGSVVPGTGHGTAVLARNRASNSTSAEVTASVPDVVAAWPV